MRAIGTGTVLSSSTLTGDKVVNSPGEALVPVEDYMLDLENGRIRYVVLSFGGFLGMGDRLFAIPPEAMRVDTENKEIILEVDRSRLENAPGFDKDNWPDTAEDHWQVEVYDYYGFTPYWR